MATRKIKKAAAAERSMVFDTSTIISLASNNLLWILGELKKKFKGHFYISSAVRREVIDVPLQSKKFKLEAMQVLSEVAKGNLEIFGHSEVVEREIADLSVLANSIFMARGNYIRIAHSGELATVAIARLLGSQAVLIDERTTRILIEEPFKLADLLESKLHTPISVNKGNLNRFREKVDDVPVMRSAELGVIAYEMGLFDRYALSGEEKYVSNPKLNVLDGTLWGLRLRGCAISTEEIEAIIKIEGFFELKPKAEAGNL
ncbi:MAG TPA: hypothetical protein HA362_05725 [Nanoarchaeota archaeon]|nr:hypothetical protein [Nanoarchaeota archaeon]